MATLYQYCSVQDSDPSWMVLEEWGPEDCLQKWNEGTKEEEQWDMVSSEEEDWDVGVDLVEENKDSKAKTKKVSEENAKKSSRRRKGYKKEEVVMNADADN